MQSPRKLDEDDDLNTKKAPKDETDDKGWKLRSRLVRDEQAGIFADGVSRYIVVKWMFITVSLEVIFYLWLLQYRRANVKLDTSLPLIIFGMVVVCLFNLFAGIGAWRRQPRRLKYGLVATAAALVILSIPTYALTHLQTCDASGCAIQDYPEDGGAEPGAPHTDENWKQCEMLGKLKRHFGMTFFFLGDRPYSFNVHPTKDKETVSGSNALRAMKVMDVTFRPPKDVVLMKIEPTPAYYTSCDQVRKEDIYSGNQANWKKIYCPGSAATTSSFAELPPAQPTPAVFVQTLSSQRTASSGGRQLTNRTTSPAAPGARVAIVREHRTTTEQQGLAAHNMPPNNSSDAEVSRVAQEVAGIANDTRKLTSELNAMISQEKQISDQVADLQTNGRTNGTQPEQPQPPQPPQPRQVPDMTPAPRSPRTPRAVAIRQTTANTNTPQAGDAGCKCMPGGCNMALGGDDVKIYPHKRDRFWCRLSKDGARACMERFLRRRDDPAKPSLDVAGSPSWPIFIFPEKKPGSNETEELFWTFGLCEEARNPDWDTDAAGEKDLAKVTRLLSYDDEAVRKRKCQCTHEKWCSFLPWQKDLGIDKVDYFFGYKDGCEVDEDETCYFKAVAKDPKDNTHTKHYYSYEPCDEWKKGANNDVLEQLVMFCEIYKLITVVGFCICAAAHVWTILAGFVFLKNSCADPVGTTFTSFDTWADQKLDYDGDAWSDPWTDSD